MLKQSGTRVTGTLTVAGTADGPIEGIVDGNTIKLREQGGPSETPALTVKRRYDHRVCPRDYADS
jgi:hypothetical protein